MMNVHLTHDPLNAAFIESLVRSEDCGALVTFAGTVRDHERGTKITAIVYEAYATMARKVLARIAQEVAVKYGARVSIHHRIGRVPVGDAGVVVAAAAPHRPEAFSACREAIDRLKADAPIWKVAFESAVAGPKEIAGVS